MSRSTRIGSGANKTTGIPQNVNIKTLIGGVGSSSTSVRRVKSQLNPFFNDVTFYMGIPATFFEQLPPLNNCN
jgi:hypothetical protein